MTRCPYSRAMWSAPAPRLTISNGLPDSIASSTNLLWPAGNKSRKFSGADDAGVSENFSASRSDSRLQHNPCMELSLTLLHKLVPYRAKKCVTHFVFSRCLREIFV